MGLYPRGRREGGGGGVRVNVDNPALVKREASRLPGVC